MEDPMAFPDRIERTIEIAHQPAAVWAALTTAEGLGAWFGNRATIDLRPGGAARLGGGRGGGGRAPPRPTCGPGGRGAPLFWLPPGPCRPSPTGPRPAPTSSPPS